MEAIKFRTAEKSDLPKIVEIYNSTVPTRMATADTEPVSVASREQWFDEHDSNRPLWVVEDVQNCTLGWVSFQSFYGRPAYQATVEISIYINPESRGKGLGKRILEYCLNQAPKYGIKTLVGFIFSHNTPSLRLFQQFGFEQWGQLPNIAVLDGLEKSLTILGKRITT